MKKKRKMLFKLGDIVRIKEKFYDNRFYHDPGVADQMRNFQETIQTIGYGFVNEYDNTVQYNFVKNNNNDAWMYVWAEEWLELVESEKDIELEELDLMKMF